MMPFAGIRGYGPLWDACSSIAVIGLFILTHCWRRLLLAESMGCRPIRCDGGGDRLLRFIADQYSGYEGDFAGPVRCRLLPWNLLMMIPVTRLERPDGAAGNRPADNRAASRPIAVQPLNGE